MGQHPLKRSIPCIVRLSHNLTKQRTCGIPMVNPVLGSVPEHAFNEGSRALSPSTPRHSRSCAMSRRAPQAACAKQGIARNEGRQGKRITCGFCSKCITAGQQAGLCRRCGFPMHILCSEDLCCDDKIAHISAELFLEISEMARIWNDGRQRKHLPCGLCSECITAGQRAGLCRRCGMPMRIRCADFSEDLCCNDAKIYRM